MVILGVVAATMTLSVGGCGSPAGPTMTDRERSFADDATHLVGSVLVEMAKLENDPSSNLNDQELRFLLSWHATMIRNAAAEWSWPSPPSDRLAAAQGFYNEAIPHIAAGADLLTAASNMSGAGAVKRLHQGEAELKAARAKWRLGEAEMSRVFGGTGWIRSWSE